MTPEEKAYKLLIKYSGKKGIEQLREMIQRLGVENTANALLSGYNGNEGNDIEKWLLMGLNYLKGLIANQPD